MYEQYEDRQREQQQNEREDGKEEQTSANFAISGADDVYLIVLSS